MTINALNSGAKAWMADFEDATAPSWFNVVDGQLNLFDALRGQIDFTDEGGKRYEVGAVTPTVLVRPVAGTWTRGTSRWTADQCGRVRGFRAVLLPQRRDLDRRRRGPYFYLPKLESHLEARLWNDVFSYAEDRLEIPYGAIRATCLIETTPAAFEMEEILYELRDHSAGLNAGRWDYIFSMIKNFADDEDHLLPDRSQVTMTSPFMTAYAELLVKTCHARGAHAIGGMAAFVPSKANPDATAAAWRRPPPTSRGRPSRVRRLLGCPSGVGVDLCRGVHGRARRPSEPARAAARGRFGVRGPADRRQQHARAITMEGLRTNIRVSLTYLAAWIGGSGAVAIDNLMEDAATVEISRMQVWQWLRHHAGTEDGTPVTDDLVNSIVTEELDRLAREASRLGRASSTAPGCLHRELPDP